MKKHENGIEVVSMKDETGHGLIVLAIAIVAFVIVFVILALPVMECLDCDDVVGHDTASYWEMRDKEDYLRIGWQPGYCMGQSHEQKVCAIVQWWDSDGVKHDDRIGGADFSDAIAKLDDAIDTFGMSDGQKRDSHHIIDCIHRGCVR